MAFVIVHMCCFIFSRRKTGGAAHESVCQLCFGLLKRPISLVIHHGDRFLGVCMISLSNHWKLLLAGRNITCVSTPSPACLPKFLRASSFTLVVAIVWETHSDDSVCSHHHRVSSGAAAVDMACPLHMTSFQFVLEMQCRSDYPCVPFTLILSHPPYFLAVSSPRKNQI